MLIKYWTNLTACSCVFATRLRSSGKVTFSVVCVCLSRVGERRGSHVPLPHSTGRDPHSHAPRHETFLYRDPCPLLVTSGGHHWGPVQACSLPTARRHPVTTIEKHTVGGRYASNWNAFLFLHCLWNLSDWVLYPNLPGTLSSMFVQWPLISCWSMKQSLYSCNLTN